MDSDNRDRADGNRRLSLLQVAASVLAAGFGVQSDRNRERDFRYGSPKTFIAAGLIGTAVFVLSLCVVVATVTGRAGA